MKKYLVKEMREKTKLYTRKYLLIKKEGSNGGNEEQEQQQKTLKKNSELEEILPYL